MSIKEESHYIERINILDDGISLIENMIESLFLEGKISDEKYIEETKNFNKCRNILSDMKHSTDEFFNK